MIFNEAVLNIKAADLAAGLACKEAWHRVAKPLNSLGLLEELTCRMAAAQGKSIPSKKHPFVLIFCGDNGVVAEGVSQSGSNVTSAVALSIARGESNINIMAAKAGAELLCFDVGMKDDLREPGLIARKAKNGTNNFKIEAAMSRDDTIYAIEAGIYAAELAKAKGADILCIGEMGIGNTTTSAAIIHVLTQLPVDSLTGRGSGLSDEGLEKKKNAIKKCVEVNKPNRADALDVLSKCGGFDIAAMCGACLGAAALGLPVILDGLISYAAALIAKGIKPECVSYMLASHVSSEPAGEAALEALGLEAPIHARLALGEGTGAVLLLPMLDMALAELTSAHSFDSIGVEQYVPQGDLK